MNGARTTPECSCGCPDNTPTQHGAFCARYGMLRGFGREVGDPCPNHCAGPNGPVLLKSFGEGPGCEWCGWGAGEPDLIALDYLADDDD